MPHPARPVLGFGRALAAFAPLAFALTGCEGTFGDSASAAAATSGATGNAATSGASSGEGGGGTMAVGSGGANGSGGAGGDTSCVVEAEAAAQIAAYRALYDEAYAPDATDFDAMAASGDGGTYYTFQYVLDATLSIYEATGDAGYAARALGWAKAMIGQATIIDAKGYANWKGEWCIPSYFDGGGGSGECAAPMIAYQLDDFQGSVELARLARLVLLDPSSTPSDVAVASEVRAFVAKDVVEKWGPKGRGSIAILLDNAQDLTGPLSDKTALLGRILLDLQVTAESLGPLPDEPDYTPWITTIAQSFTSRLAAYDPGNAQSCAGAGDCSPPGDDGDCGSQPATPPPSSPEALTWDVGVGWDNCQAMDTSHANRYPYLASELLHQGIVVEPPQILGLARLLSRVLWNGSVDDPRVRNFIDGSQCTYIGRGPDGDGLIYSGWAVLAEWDDEAFAATDAVLSGLVAGVCNPTLGYNGTVYGRMELPAHLAKAAKLRACAK